MAIIANSLTIIMTMVIIKIKASITFYVTIRSIMKQKTNTMMMNCIADSIKAFSVIILVKFLPAVNFPDFKPEVASLPILFM